jgi:voltage-gated potassium channel Kch
MRKSPTLRERLDYAFDNYMSRGTLALIGGLFIVSLIIVLIAGAAIALGGGQLGPANDQGATEAISFGEAVWEAMMRTLDAGTMGGDVGWGFRGVMFVVTLGGVFVISTLIGVLTTGVEGKLEQLRKGRSRVLENGHTVILGWSPQVFTILSELMTANENKKNVRIVILADKDKIEMEEEIRDRVEKKGSTRVICRNGNPIDLTDLELASPHTAKSIIVLPPDDNDPDTYVIKTILAITNNSKRHDEKYHIVTQIRDARNMDVVKMIGSRDLVQPVLTGDLIARVVAQTSRQSGLSVVYTELLNFGGDELYFKNEPALVGKTFGEALMMYENSCVMGMRFADGQVALNPPMDTRFAPGDYLFALTQDDDTIALSGLTSFPVDETAIHVKGKARKPVQERALILGWNRCAGTIIRELNNYVASGSRVLIVADPEVSMEVEAGEAAVKETVRRLSNQKVTFQGGDTTDRGLLEEIKAADYDHVIVLSYAGLDVQEADAKTLVTLLHLRNIAEHDNTPFSIVSEMLDLRNRELAEVTHVDDFIVSDHLVSLMMSQISEVSDLFDVFADIFDPEGSEIYLKPIGDYVDSSKPVNFYTVVEAARRRGQIAIGYRLMSEAGEKEKSYGVHTNPKKSDLVTFAPEDKIIVVAEE